MSPTECSVPRWTPRPVWPARSRAEVVFYPGERGRVERIARRLFGRRLRAWEYAGLAGAPDGARVKLGTFGGQLSIETSHRSASCYRLYHYVERRPAGVVIVKDGFQILLGSMRRKGLGTRIFHRQLENARALGVVRIETRAGRSEDENGYYTWPRFGFDGPLSKRIKQALPLGLEHVDTVLELMDCEKGRMWWREHGETIDVAFDLSDGSRSQKVFQRYVLGKLKHGWPKRRLEIRTAM